MIRSDWSILRAYVIGERSERDTIRGVQIRAGAVYIYIYLLRTPPRCSLEINVFELG